MNNTARWSARLVFAMVLAGGVIGRPMPKAWAQDPIHKMGRGLVNVLTGWLELPIHLNLGWQSHSPVTGAALGLITGAGRTVLRTGVGLYEVVTFPIPIPKGFASPYEGMALSEYAWE